MTRRIRALLAGVSLAATSLILGLPLAMEAPGAAAAGPSVPAQMVTCFQQSHQMVIDLLMDQTGSLGQSDPQNRRVDFAKAIVGQLTQLQLATHGTVQIGANGFGDSYPTTPTIPFQTVSSDSAASFNQRINAAFRENHGDWHTDYVTALDGAQQNLVAQAQAMAPSNPDQVCKLIVWLTDGVFDVSYQSGEPGYAPSWNGGQRVTLDNQLAIAQSGIDRLCRPGNIADQLRSEPNLFLFAVGLGPASQDFSLMKSIALQQGQPGPQWSSGPCGSLPNQRAAFVTGDNLGQLAGTIISEATGSPAVPVNPCVPGNCSYSFTTYPHTVGEDLFLEPQGFDRLHLTAPTGRRIDLVDGAKGIRGTSVSIGAGTYPVVRLSFVPGVAPVGSWTVSADASTTSSLTLVARPDTGITLVSAAAPKWKRGVPGTATFELRWRGGSLPAALQPTSATGEATVRLHSGDETTVPLQLGPGGLLTMRWRPPADDRSSTTRILASATLVLPAAEGGLSVPVAAASRATIGLSGLPGTGSSTINFGLIRPVSAHMLDPQHGAMGKAVAVSTSVTVYGPPGDAGAFCVLAGPYRPHGAGPSGQIRADGCVAVPAGGVVHVPVTLDLPATWNGSISGGSVNALSKAGGKTAHVSIFATGSVLVPIAVQADQATFWALILLTLLGALLAWTAGAFLSSRLVRANELQGFAVRATLRDGAIDLEPPKFDASSWRFLSSAGTWHDHRASLDSDLGAELKLRAPIRLVTVQDVLVESEGAVLEGSAGRGRRQSPKGRIAHRIQGEWVFAVPESLEVTAETTELPGVLYVFVRSGAEAYESEPDEVLLRARADLPSLFPGVKERLEAFSFQRSEAVGETDDDDDDDDDDEDLPSEEILF